MTAAAATTQKKAPAGLSNKAREMMEAINAEAGKHQSGCAPRRTRRRSGPGSATPAARQRTARRRPGRRQPDQDGAAPLALERDRPLSRPHRRDRQQLRRLADRVRRAPAVPADQSRARRPAAGDQHHPLRGLDLQSGRRRAGAHPHPQCEPHHPLRQRRLHRRRGRALRRPRAATSSSPRTAPGTTTATTARPRWCGSTCSISR